MIPVLVTTEFRGVFFGWIDPAVEGERTLRVEKVRNAIYWSGKRGFLGLASHGPENGSRVGAEAPEVTLHGVTSVSRCTEEAAERWTQWKSE